MADQLDVARSSGPKYNRLYKRMTAFSGLTRVQVRNVFRFDFVSSLHDGIAEEG